MADDPDEDDAPEEECPKCPPAGAPAWMATFADMATLLMAFFVMILSFAEMNVPKFKQIQGSLKNSFGVQRLIPIVEQPMGTSIITQNFSPSPSPSITENMTTETTQIEQPKLKIPSDVKDSEGANEMAEGAQDEEGLGGENQDGTGKDQAKNDAEKLAEAIEQIAQAADVAVSTLEDKVIVDLKAENDTPSEMKEKIKKVGQAVSLAELATGKSDQEVLYGGLDEQLNELIEFVSELEDKLKKLSGKDAEEGFVKTAQAEKKAQSAAEELKVKLQEEIDMGAVNVETRDNKVFVTVGTGGAFPSGSANLTPQAQEIIDQITQVSDGADNSITVAGHTDDVPIAFGALYRDNWDLAAARAASVVQEVEQSGLIETGRLQAVSYGETRPIANNSSAEGREQNRRIEIELEYE
ncbi:MAG: flagellar motor protein MotB [Aestuariivita sp.]|nr:flagellar motor protein MotB [Aestuariivita sp.]